MVAWDLLTRNATESTAEEDETAAHDFLFDFSFH
jgi:hypothetical protein